MLGNFPEERTLAFQGFVHSLHRYSWEFDILKLACDSTARNRDCCFPGRGRLFATGKSKASRVCELSFAQRTRREFVIANRYVGGIDSFGEPFSVIIPLSHSGSVCGCLYIARRCAKRAPSPRPLINLP